MMINIDEFSSQFDINSSLHGLSNKICFNLSRIILLTQLFLHFHGRLLMIGLDLKALGLDEIELFALKFSVHQN